MWVEEVPGTFSPVYWGRYVDWVLTTPLMLWDILALAGAPNDEIAMVVIMDMLMIGLDAPELKPQTKTSGFSSFLAWSLSSTSRCSLEIQQSQQVRRRSTCSLQQSRLDDHY